MAKPALRKTGARIARPAADTAGEYQISVVDRNFQVSKIKITWSDGKTETLYPGDIKQKITYLIGRVAALKNKKPEDSKMFYRASVYWHSLNGNLTEQELKAKGKAKKTVYNLLRNSSRP